MFVQRLNRWIRGALSQSCPSSCSSDQVATTPHSRRRESLVVASAPTVETYQEALRLWLQWNDGYEQLTTRMYDARHAPEELETLAEQLERLRQKAIAASRVLIDNAASSPQTNP